MKTWRCKDGRVLPIHTMETEHIVNCVAMLKRNGYCTLAEYEDAITPGGFTSGSMAEYYDDQRTLDAFRNMKPCHELDWFEEELEKRGVGYA